MTEQLKIATPPELCDECATDLMRQAHASTKPELISAYCPHNWTMAVAWMMTHEGRIVLGRWEFVGPLTLEDARTAMDGYAKIHGTQRVTLNPMRLQ